MKTSGDFYCEVCGSQVAWDQQQPAGVHYVEQHGWHAATERGSVWLSGVRYDWIAGDYVAPELFDAWRAEHDQ